MPEIRARVPHQEAVHAAFLEDLRGVAFFDRAAIEDGHALGGCGLDERFADKDSRFLDLLRLHRVVGVLAYRPYRLVSDDEFGKRFLRQARKRGCKLLLDEGEVLAAFMALSLSHAQDDRKPLC